MSKDPPYLPRHRIWNQADIEATIQMLEQFRDRHIRGAWVRLEQAAP